jgi:CHAT domain
MTVEGDAQRRERAGPIVQVLARVGELLEVEQSAPVARRYASLLELLHRLYPNIDVSNLHRGPPARLAAVAAKLATAGAADSPRVAESALALFEGASGLIYARQVAAADEIERLELSLVLLCADVESGPRFLDKFARKQLLGKAPWVLDATDAERFTDLTLYEGSVFRPEDLLGLRKLADSEPLLAGHCYTLEVAIRRDRSGIGAAEAAAFPVLNPRQAKETLHILVRVASVYGPVAADQPIAPVEWPFDDDSTPAFFRLTITALDREVAEAALEVRLYHSNLDLLDVMRVKLTVAAGPQIQAPGSSVSWPRDDARPRLDPDSAVRRISIDVRPAAVGYAFQFLFRRGEQVIVLPFTRILQRGDLEALLARVRDFWTELAIGNYSDKLTVSRTTWNGYLLRMRELGLLSWDLLFGGGEGGNRGASELVGDLLAKIEVDAGTHIQIIYDPDVTDFVFPWNLLYPPEDTREPVDVDRFWGARFQVEQVRKGSNWNDLHVEPVRVAIALDPKFGQAEAEEKMFDDMLAHAGTRLEVRHRSTTRDELITALHDTPPAHLYYFFCHGYAPAGPSIMRRDGAQLLREKIEEAPPDVRRAFETLLSLTAKMGDQPWIFIGDAEITESMLRQSRGFFRGRSPVVFLNMCHSAALLPSMSSGFARLFLERNAAAVIGTESPMTSVFAHAFAERFFAHLLGGDDLGTALLHARRGFLSAEQRNPLGLAYTLYGRATLKIGGAPILPDPHSAHSTTAASVRSGSATPAS